MLVLGRGRHLPERPQQRRLQVPVPAMPGPAHAARKRESGQPWIFPVCLGLRPGASGHGHLGLCRRLACQAFPEDAADLLALLELARERLAGRLGGGAVRMNDDQIKGQDDNQPEDMTTGVTACGPGGLRTQIDDPGVADASRSAPAIVTAREPGDATVTPRPDDGEPSPVEEGDGASAGEEAALAPRERIAAERARYEQLTRYRDEAAARVGRLVRDVNRAERGSRHGDEAFSRWQQAGEEHRAASNAADAHLRVHPNAVAVYGAARRWLALGVCTVPVKDDGSKAPFGEWKQYQGRLPTDEELLAWHRAGTSGLGIVCGRTDCGDGCGIEMFEPEGRAVREGIWDEFLDRIAEAGLTGCWERIAAGYHEKTPGGGTHYYWLCTEYSGNIKLATRLANDEELAENPDDKYKTLLETRGRGGYSVAAPTPGSFHESGRPWTSEVLPETIIVITPEEREGILGCARACSKVPKGAIHEHPERMKHETLSGPDRSPAGLPLRTRPGDVFNQRGPDWSEILEPRGWRLAREEADGTRHWTRPGKAGGTSATTGNPQHEGDKFHVFTSSTEFEPDTPYSKFAAYAILEYDGDFSAAAAHLVRHGYVPGRLSRHAAIPRLRVPPPAELDEYADQAVKEVMSPLRDAAEAARPEDPDADDAEWGDIKAVMDLVEPAAEVLGGLGDLDLIDFQAARVMLDQVVLPHEYTDKLDPDTSAALEKIFLGALQRGWNKGAAEGHVVPEELQATLDSWHPPCPIPREEVEARRLPPGREGAWPVQNFVAKIDDRGNARRLMDHHGDRILFAHSASGLSVYAFDRQQWLDPANGGRGLAAELADQTIGSLAVTEAMSLSVAVSRFDRDGNPVSDRGRFWPWLNAQQSDARRTGMIHSAEAIPGMRVSVSDFDADPRWLNTPSGEVDLGRAEIGDDGTWRVAEPVVFTGRHFPEHRHTRITGAPYDPSATCPEFEQAMKDWLDDDEMITYVGKLVAASVRGLVTLKAIPLLLGAGNSGKSTFLEVMMSVLGGYATTAQPSILRKGKGGSTLTDDLDDLRGFRLVTTTETSGAEEMDEARVKRLSGGDRVRARGLYKSSAAWDPQFLLWLATNFMPRLSGHDLALWGRFAPVMFPYLFTETGLAPDDTPCGVIDPNLKGRLIAEARGILSWTIRHLELLYSEGLREPGAVTAKRRELQSLQDTVGRFLAAVEADSGADDGLSPGIVADKGLAIRETRFHKHYVAWAGKDITPVGNARFREALENHKVKITRPGNVETVHGFGHDPKRQFGCPVCDEPLPREARN